MEDLRKTPDEPAKKLGSFLREQAKKLNLKISGTHGLTNWVNEKTQTTGSNINIKDASMGHYSRGTQWPSDLSRRKIAEAFGFTLEQFDYFLYNDVTEDEAREHKKDSTSELGIKEIIAYYRKNPDKREELVKITTQEFKDDYLRIFVLPLLQKSLTELLLKL